MLRDSPDKTEVKAKDDSSSGSGEYTQENFDKMAATLEKHFGKKDADEFKEIAARINAAKDDEEKKPEDYVSLFIFSFPFIIQ